MTIASTYSPPQYTGNAVTIAFAFPFVFFAASELVVDLFDTGTGAAVSPQPVLGGAGTYDYTVTGVQDADTGEYLAGASITFNTAPPANFRITVYREVVNQQNTSLSNNSRFPAKTVEAALDRRTLIDQQQAEQLGRAIVAPISDGAPNMVLPVATSRANRMPIFDSVGGISASAFAVSALTALLLSWSLNPLNSTAYLPPYTGSVMRTIGDKLAEEITPEDFGALGGAAVDTVAVQKAIDALTPGKQLYLRTIYTIGGLGCNITNKSGIKITGPGGLKLASGSDVNAACLLLVGTCDSVYVSCISMEGEANAGATYFQKGVYSNSGQTLSNIHVDGCKIKNLNAGISYNAASSGSYNGAWATFNTIINMVGTIGGQGYGVHGAGVQNFQVFGNDISFCQRHSVYDAEGSSTDPSQASAHFIAYNTIRWHRFGVAPSEVRPAIFADRGHGGVICNNWVYDYRDGAIAVSHDTVAGFDTSGWHVYTNHLWGRRNDVASMWIGELANPTTNRTSKVYFYDNDIKSDIAVGGRANDIVVYNCLGFGISRNKIHTDNILNLAYVPISIGTWSSGGAADLDNGIVDDNVVTGTLAAANPGVSPINFLEFNTAVCSGNSRVRVTGNQVQNELLNKMVSYVSSKTNPKLVVQDQWGGIPGVYIAGDLTPSVFGGVTNMYIANSGAVAITALDDGSPGQVVTLTFADTNTTIKFSTGNIYLAGGADFVSTAHDTLTLMYSLDYAHWVETGRSVNG